MLTLGIGEGARKSALKNVYFNFIWLTGCSYCFSRGRIKKNKRNKKRNLNHSNINNDIQSCLVLLDNISSYNNSIANLNKPCGNGSCKSFHKCKSKIFKLKPNFVSSDKLISTSSKNIFDCCVVPNETTYTEYDSPNITYVIICNRCSLQYVPETVQKLNKRFNWKRTRFKQPDKYGFCCILSDHLHKNVFCNTSYLVQILEKITEKW